MLHLSRRSSISTCLSPFCVLQTPINSCGIIKISLMLMFTKALPPRQDNQLANLRICPNTAVIDSQLAWGCHFFKCSASHYTAMASKDKGKEQPKCTYTKNKFHLAGTADGTNDSLSPQALTSLPRLCAAPLDSHSKWVKMEEVLKVISKDFCRTCRAHEIL